MYLHCFKCSHHLLLLLPLLLGEQGWRQSPQHWLA
jgi:hypothetical protein